MVLAKLSNGALIIGLSAENLRRLQTGKEALRISNETHAEPNKEAPLPPGLPAIYICYGETEQKITEDLAAIFPDSAVH